MSRRLASSGNAYLTLHVQDQMIPCVSVGQLIIGHPDWRPELLAASSHTGGILVKRAAPDYLTALNPFRENTALIAQNRSGLAKCRLVERLLE